MCVLVILSDAFSALERISKFNTLILFCKMVLLCASPTTLRFYLGTEREKLLLVCLRSEEILGSCNEVLMARCAVTFLIPQCYRATNTPPLFFLGL
jgi:hypothetical protein